MTYSNKLEFLIEALVKTSRLESGVFQFLPREQSLSELAQKVCDAGAYAIVYSSQLMHMERMRGWRETSGFSPINQQLCRFLHAFRC